MTEPAERRLAVLFADVSGSTALYEALGDREALGVVSGCLGSLRAIAHEFGGRVVKTTGDGLLCVFDDPEGAVGAGSQMQERLAARRAAQPATPPIRVGIAAGPVLEDAGDVFGDTVNVAARIADIAKAGQVLTTGATLATLAAAMRASCRLLPPVELKGVSGSVPLVEVLWNVEATLTMVVDSSLRAAPGATRYLLLSFRGRDVRVDAERRQARLGRDPGNDVVVAMPLVSRWHARIVFQQDNFELVDESVNGTFLRLEGKPEIHLQRDRTLLFGRGVIGLGRSAAGDDDAAIAFSTTS